MTSRSRSSSLDNSAPGGKRAKYVPQTYQNHHAAHDSSWFHSLGATPTMIGVGGSGHAGGYGRGVPMSGGGGYSGNVSVMSSAILGMDDRSFGQGFGGDTPSALDISNAAVLAANNLSGGHGGMATGAGGMRFQLGLSTSPLPHNFSISPMLGMAGRDLTSPAVGDTSFGLGGMQVFNQSGIGMGALSNCEHDSRKI